MIRRGEADAVLAGGTESAIHPLILAGFCSMRALVAENGDPSRACRPFDSTRAGFVIGEGAGVVMLEQLESARNGETQRSTPRCSAPAPPTTPTTSLQPDPNALGVAEMIHSALTRAGVAPERVDYINAHGTATPLGDAAETKAIKEVFGSHAYRIPISAQKSMTGHAIGAAGAIELAATALILHHQVATPTINYEVPDPECDLDYVPNEAREAHIDVALSNAMGLGGHNGCVLLGRTD